MPESCFTCLQNRCKCIEKAEKAATKYGPNVHGNNKKFQSERCQKIASFDFRICHKLGKLYSALSTKHDPGEQWCSWLPNLAVQLVWNLKILTTKLCYFGGHLQTALSLFECLFCVANFASAVREVSIKRCGSYCVTAFLCWTKLIL